MSRTLSAARRLQDAVSEGLGPYVPGEPRGLPALVAVRSAARLLAGIAEAYGVERWTWTEVRRALFEGALAPWRRGEVEEAGPLVTVAGRCPVAEQVERDPRVCALCRGVQECLVRGAMPGQVRRVEFQRFGSRGRAACLMLVERKAGEGADGKAGAAPGPDRRTTPPGRPVRAPTTRKPSYIHPVKVTLPAHPTSRESAP